MKRVPGIRLLKETEGSGAAARKGDRVTYNLRLFLNKGDEVPLDEQQQGDVGRDAKRIEGDRQVIDRVATLGRREVVAAVEYGLNGMRAGGYRKLKASPHLAYGTAGIPGLVPENAVLVLELWLRAIEAAARNEHFETVADWSATAPLIAFRPFEPKDTLGHDLQSLQVHVRDHKRREIAVGDRTLEAYYGAFVLSQQRSSHDAARRLAHEVSYGRTSTARHIAGHDARVYPLGPVPAPDDVDGREPSVVTWSEGEMFYLIASDQLPADALVRVAESFYER